MTAPILRADHLGKRYGRRWALHDCTIEIEPGHVTGLVGPNGSGKTTLLSLASGMLRPTAGTIEVCGAAPASDPEQLARVGYVAQHTPLYSSLSVADHLRLGAHLNPGWDRALAQQRIAHLGLDPKQRAGKLSGGQRAQLALVLGLAKRPELLLLDEPVASLDPLARREFLQSLMEAVAEYEVSIVLSSHVVSDLERVCDHVVVLVDSTVRIEGALDRLLDTHLRLVGPAEGGALPPQVDEIVHEEHSERQTTLILRTSDPVLDPAWSVSRLDLEDIVLAYIERGAPTKPLEVVR